MKKTTRRVIAIAASFILLLILLLLITSSKYIYAIRQMKPVETRALNDSVYCIRNKYVNAWVFEVYRGYIMIDAGISKKKMKEELSKLEINPDDILAVVLTHSDPDHSGGLNAFENAKIFLHEEEEQMVNGQTARFIFKSKWKYDDYNLIRSEEILNINVLQIKVIHTPGHTPGSCCFIINDDYLVSGDNLIFENGVYKPFFDIINMDTETQVKSLKKLPSPDNFKYILTSHTGFSNTDQ
ncbi:MAG: MBL fold metallo-hydrolase [Bacteroidales bacterium]|nr:MBL fold metallo-hydrolase [Bacteroidales bacterium]